MGRRRSVAVDLAHLAAVTPGTSDVFRCPKLDFGARLNKGFFLLFFCQIDGDI